MKSLFTRDTFEEVSERLHSLSENDTPKWGSMNVAQMLCHCQNAFEIPLGLKEGMRPNFLMRLLMKAFKPNMYNDKPWRHNMPTPKAFKVTGNKDFLAEKERLLELATTFYEKGEQHDWPKHPAFGKFTATQWGKMQYKHLDHHLRQFGA